MRLLIRLYALPLIAALLFGCAGAGTTTGEFVDDSVVTTKVKAKLVEDPVTSAWDIRVTTVNGTVQLSGFVKSDREKERAGELARAVPGVKSVVNDVIVK